MFTGQKIEIAKRGRLCSRCETPFKGKDRYTSLVVPETWERQDYCAPCWEASPHQESTTHWTAQVPEKEPKEELSQDKDERAFQLFQMAKEGGQEEEAFILSLYLARKRILLLRSEADDWEGQVMQLYEVRTTEEMVTVKKFPLSSLAVKTLQEELAQKMNGNG